MDYPVISPRKPKWVKCVDEDLLTKEDPTKTDLLRISVMEPEKTPKPYKRGLPLKKGFEYKDYQLKVLEWCCERERGYLSLQMGLGKTLLGISIPACDHRSKTPALIVCPLNVINEWVVNGFKKFFGTFYRYYVLHSSWDKKNTGPSVKDLSYDDLKNYDYVLTTYETTISSYKERSAEEWYYVKDYSGKTGLGPVDDSHLDKKQVGVALIHSVKWSHVVFDEIHNCSNHRNVSAKACYKISSYKRWGLSGTKVRNRSEDLWFQAKILHFPTSDIPYSSKKKDDLERIYQNKNSYIFEANYEVAKVELPELNRKYISLEFDPEHQKLYRIAIGDLRKAIGEFEMGLCGFSCILELFLRLRQISVSPKIVNSSYPLGGKIPAIVDFVKKTKEKTIIMSSFVQGLNILGEELDKLGIPYSTLTGEVSIKKRGKMIEDFQKNKKVLLANYKVAGVGLNLQFATQWISLEPWWNESVHSQGYQRIWRPGQTRPCTIMFYLFPGMEKAVMDMAEKKDELSRAALGKTLDFRHIKMDKDMIKKFISE